MLHVKQYWKHIIGLWVGIGVTFSLPPALYAYAHDDEPFSVFGIYFAIYMLFVAIVCAVIRGVNAK